MRNFKRIFYLRCYNGSVTIVENNSTTKNLEERFSLITKINDETIAISDGAFDIKLLKESE